ncbi:MAG TPA: divalent-cation tolerance protein CutA [Rhizomicrobium sp.]|jgi:periplasmic divalent cation tolerance protein
MTKSEDIKREDIKREDIKPEDGGIVWTALPNREEARRIARILLAEKLAACVQLLDMESHYVWQGAAMAETEVMLLAKTRAALFESVIARIKALHPYELPEIVAQPFAAGFAPYLTWIADSTDQEHRPGKV